MNESRTPPPPADSRGTRTALIFALAAGNLQQYYEHGQWPTEAQGATLAADWLARTRRSLPLHDRRRLASLGDALARRLAGELSREAGLHVAHEMMEALDPNHETDLTRALMAECERLLDEGDGPQTPSP